MIKSKYGHGFTLVELLITISIMGVIMMIALPSYQDSQRKSKRVEAHAGLIKMQLEQENFRMLNAAYASATGTGSNDVKAISNDYYTFSITSSSSTAYTLTATAKTGSSQANDTGCTAITLTQDGTKSPATCW